MATPLILGNAVATTTALAARHGRQPWSALKARPPSLCIFYEAGFQPTLTISENQRPFAVTCSLSPVDLEDRSTNIATMEGISVASTATESGNIKMKVDVSGDKTEAIFDSVFSKMVAAAQPISGFRRVKGGQTPNIPRDVLIQVIGPSKVYKQVIKKIINSTVAEYVEKENLKVTKNLRVEQSFEELESSFEPGELFSFDAIIQLQEKNV